MFSQACVILSTGGGGLSSHNAMGQADSPTPEMDTFIMFHNNFEYIMWLVHYEILTWFPILGTLFNDASMTTCDYVMIVTVFVSGIFDLFDLS